MRKLPVIDAFAHAARSTANNLAFAFHVSWPWMLVLLPILIVTNALALTNLDFNPVTDPFPAGFLAAALGAGLAQAVAFASIAVNWHRYVLLDEMPQGAQRLRIDGMVWRYFGNILLIALIIGLCGGLGALIIGFASAAFGDLGFYIAMALLIAGVLYAFAAFYRLGVKLPAIALERRDFGLRDAWRITTGNNARMLGLGLLYLIVGVAGALLAAALGAAFGLFGSTIGAAFSVAVQLVINWVLTILGITLLTSLYGYFVEDRNF